MKQILILANHSGGLYDFRKDLIAELKERASVAVAVPPSRGSSWTIRLCTGARKKRSQLGRKVQDGCGICRSHYFLGGFEDH